MTRFSTASGTPVERHADRQCRLRVDLSGSIVAPRTDEIRRKTGIQGGQGEPPPWISTANWGGMGPEGAQTHRLDRNDDPQPSVGAVVVTTLFQRADHFACLCDRMVAIPLEMRVRRTQNIEIRDYSHDQAVTVLSWWCIADTANHSFSFDHRCRPDTFRTAIATAFFWPTSTTRRFPRVTPV